MCAAPDTAAQSLQLYSRAHTASLKQGERAASTLIGCPGHHILHIYIEKSTLSYCARQPARGTKLQLVFQAALCRPCMQGSPASPLPNQRRALSCFGAGCSPAPWCGAAIDTSLGAKVRVQTSTKKATKQAEEAVSFLLSFFPPCSLFHNPFMVPWLLWDSLVVQ